MPGMLRQTRALLLAARRMLEVLGVGLELHARTRCFIQVNWHKFASKGYLGHRKS